MSSRLTVAPIHGAAPLSELSDRHALMFGPEVSAVVAGCLEVGVVAHRSSIGTVAT